ncbi:MAG TPA: hypothetical protein VJP88_04340, partial [Caulobacteraceae bacterium]|nr:hypothetical protein [Caulobacteraceae bacterium]
ELYAGLERAPTTFPVQYKGANVPQAWAAGSCFSLLQAITGLQPDAPNHRLYVDPALPDWMPELTVKDLRIGRKTVDVRFWAEDGATRWVVVKGDPALVEQRSFASGQALPGAILETKPG